MTTISERGTAERVESVPLPKTEHDRIYEDLIRPLYLDGVKASENPTIVMLGGQPGAGKTALRTQANKELGGAREVVSIDPDDLRAYYPNYATLAKEGRHAASITHEDASKWSKRLAEDARTQRKNVVLDGTLGNPDKAEEIAGSFKEAGYKVNARFMAVSYDQSFLSTYHRYEHINPGEPARSVPPHVHDEIYDGVDRSVERLSQSKHVDNLQVHGRDPTNHNKTVLLSKEDGWMNHVTALRQERNRQMTPEERRIFEEKLEVTRSRIQETDKKLQQPENKVFENFAKAYHARQKEVGTRQKYSFGTNGPRSPSAGRSAKRKF